MPCPRKTPRARATLGGRTRSIRPPAAVRASQAAIDRRAPRSPSMRMDRAAAWLPMRCGLATNAASRPALVGLAWDRRDLRLDLEVKLERRPVGTQTSGRLVASALQCGQPTRGRVEGRVEVIGHAHRCALRRTAHDMAGRRPPSLPQQSHRRRFATAPRSRRRRDVGRSSLRCAGGRARVNLCDMRCSKRASVMDPSHPSARSH